MIEGVTTVLRDVDTIMCRDPLASWRPSDARAPERRPAHPVRGAPAMSYVPAAIQHDPHSAMTTPVRWMPRTRSPSRAAASEDGPLTGKRASDVPTDSSDRRRVLYEDVR